MSAVDPYASPVYPVARRSSAVVVDESAVKIHELEHELEGARHELDATQRALNLSRSALLEERDKNSRLSRSLGRSVNETKEAQSAARTAQQTADATRELEGRTAFQNRKLHAQVIDLQRELAAVKKAALEKPEPRPVKLTGDAYVNATLDQRIANSRAIADWERRRGR